MNVLPCPFCASEDVVPTCGKTADRVPYYFMRCRSCIADGPATTDAHVSASITLWNTRRTPRTETKRKARP